MKSTPQATEDAHWNFPERRLFLLESIASLGITSQITTEQDCMAEANDLVFRFPGFADGVTPVLREEVRKFVELQNRYSRRYNTRLEFIAIQTWPKCRAFSSKGDRFEFQSDPAKLSIVKDLDRFSMYFPVQKSAKAHKASEELTFRAIIFEDNSRRLDQGRLLPATMVRAKNSADLSFAGGRGPSKIELQAFIGDGSFGTVYDAKWGAEHTGVFKE